MAVCSAIENRAIKQWPIRHYSHRLGSMGIIATGPSGLRSIGLGPVSEWELDSNAEPLAMEV